MAVSAVQTVRALPEIRYQDRLAQSWLWAHAPCAWRRRVGLAFRHVPYGLLQPAGSLTDPDRVEWWLRQMRGGRHIPPLLACSTEQNTLYLHDGNHRYLAMQKLFAPRPAAAFVRIGLLVPRRGYAFQYHWFGEYGTYLLLPVTTLDEAHFPLLPAADWYSSVRSSRCLQ